MSRPTISLLRYETDHTKSTKFVSELEAEIRNTQVVSEIAVRQSKGPASQQIEAIISLKAWRFLGFVKGWGSGPRGWGSAKARTLLRP